MALKYSDFYVLYKATVWTGGLSEGPNEGEFEVLCIRQIQTCLQTLILPLGVLLLD